MKGVLNKRKEREPKSYQSDKLKKRVHDLSLRRRG